jgi:hypothetical protein
MQYGTVLRACVCAGLAGWGGAALARSSQDAQVDYIAQIEPVFEENCAVRGCHAGAIPQRGLSLEAGKSYEAIVDVASVEVKTAVRVKPGDPQNSYLFRKLKGEQAVLGGSGDRMPPEGDPLTDEQIALIEAWISQGALEEPEPSAVAPTTWSTVKRLVQQLLE